VSGAIRCTKVNPPARPTSYAVILGILEQTGGEIRHPSSLAAKIELELGRLEADTPAPTYRVELGQQIVDAITGPVGGARNAAIEALLRAIERCANGPNDGEGLAEVDVPRTADEQFAYETIKGWAESAPTASTAGATDDMDRIEADLAAEDDEGQAAFIATPTRWRLVATQEVDATSNRDALRQYDDKKCRRFDVIPSGEGKSGSRKLRGKILGIGHVEGRSAHGWHFEGGDYAGVHVRSGFEDLACGWNVNDLQVIAQLRDEHGSVLALEVAEHMRALPALPLPVTRCPGNTVTAEELAEAFWTGSRDMGLDVLARFFPDHIAKPAATTSDAPSPFVAPDPPFFGAIVQDVGGGLVTLMVDRDTMSYPEVGSHVSVVYGGDGTVPR
jgi:hypothetical protein